jgi:thioredoxin reductase (NADPH)
MCGGSDVVVVGGGNSAGQAALFLAQHTRHVYLLIRADDPGKDMSRYLVDRVDRHPSVDVQCNTEVCEARGGDVLESLVVRDNRTGQCRTLPARALFVFIGAVPATAWLGGEVALDEDGFVRTGPDRLPAGAGDGRPQPLTLETSLPGVFAAGDVRSGSVKRVASAVGEGAIAVRMVHERHRLG